MYDAPDRHRDSARTRRLSASRPLQAAHLTARAPAYRKPLQPCGGVLCRYIRSRRWFRPPAATAPIRRRRQRCEAGVSQHRLRGRGNSGYPSAPCASTSAIRTPPLQERGCRNQSAQGRRHGERRGTLMRTRFRSPGWPHPPDDRGKETRAEGAKHGIWNCPAHQRPVRICRSRLIWVRFATG